MDRQPDHVEFSYKGTRYWADRIDDEHWDVDNQEFGEIRWYDVEIMDDDLKQQLEEAIARDNAKRGLTS